MSVQPLLLPAPQSTAPASSRGAPPGARGGAPPGAPPGVPLFESTLAEHSARTAQAEGHNQNGGEAPRRHAPVAGGGQSGAGLPIVVAPTRNAESTPRSGRGAPRPVAGEGAPAQGAPPTAGETAAAETETSTVASDLGTADAPADEGALSVPSPTPTPNQPTVSEATPVVEADVPAPAPTAGEQPAPVSVPQLAPAGASLGISSATPLPRVGQPRAGRASPGGATPTPAAPAAGAPAAPAPLAGEAPSAVQAEAPEPTAAVLATTGESWPGPAVRAQGDGRTQPAAQSAAPTGGNINGSGSGAVTGAQGGGSPAGGAGAQAPANQSPSNATNSHGPAATPSGPVPAPAPPSGGVEATQLDGSAGVAPALAAGGSAAAGGGPVLVAGVPMQDMIESIRATVEIASRQGIAQARIALKPADLGEISVHLSQSSDGLIARVTADSAAGAQALAGGRSELHQSLSSLGVSLLRLDIGSSGQSRAGDREEGSGEEAGTPRAARDSEDDGDEAIGALDARTSTIPPADGALVDVLA